MRTSYLFATVACSGFFFNASPTQAAGGIPKEYQETIKKGLKWVIDSRKEQGSRKQSNYHCWWEANNGQYPITMTALAGMVMLMEGSTVRDGKYADYIRGARNFLMSKAQPNGMLGNPRIPGEAGRYMYGHGFALLFLSSVYGEENNKNIQKELEGVLTRAAQFSRDSQTNRGGWGYVSARDGNNFDEGSVTITQVQALRAARNAGVKVPPEAIKDSIKYLQQSTNAQGGVIYSLAHGGGGAGRPALTAAAIACGFSAGEYNSPLVKKWFKFCKTQVPFLRGGRSGHDEYTHYYYAQALYTLGDDGWNKMFPEDKGDDRLSWTKYRENTFKYLKESQHTDGYWTGSHVGPIFATTVYLTILQLDNATLTIYQR